MDFGLHASDFRHEIHEKIMIFSPFKHVPHFLLLLRQLGEFLEVNIVLFTTEEEKEK